jgi:hypothetical protein
MAKKSKKSAKKGGKLMNLATCSGAGRALKKSKSKGIKSAAGRKLNKCK